MKKRIFRQTAFVIVFCVTLLAIIAGLTFSQYVPDQIKEGLRTVRVTIISVTGDVVFDNYRTGLENHADRPEVIDALAKGYGESMRYSDTLGTATYYYAMRAGDSILRLALTTDNVNRWLYGLIPLAFVGLLCVLGLCLALAKRLTNKLVTPINNLDLERINDLPYDELAPFVNKIAAQRQQITSHLDELAERAGTIKTITDNMLEGLLLVDKNGIILSSNRAADQAFDHEEGSCLGKSILHLCRNIEFLEGAKSALSGDRREMVFTQKGHVYSVHFGPVLLEDNPNGAIILLMDITDKFEAERQRKEFSANVSHELKTPLTSIIAISEMIENGIAKPEDIKGFANQINTQSSRLLMLIEDVIRLSQFDEKGIEKDFDTFDLTALAYSVADGLKPQAESKSITVNISEAPVIVKANRRMLDEMLYNLIDNAIKYNKEAGHVDVTISRLDNHTEIAVSDTGIGVGPEHQSRIFERFYRVDKSRSKRTGGTGLGLSIVKHITEFHGGHLEIESEIDKGTTIRAILPL